MTNLSRRNFLLGSVGVICILSLAACGLISENDNSAESGPQGLSQEEMLEQAADFNAEEFYDAQNKSEAKAKPEYDGKVFKASGHIEDIYTDNIIVSEYTYGVYCYPLTIELPEDKIAELSKEQEIAVCGTFEYTEHPTIPRPVDAFVVE